MTLGVRGHAWRFGSAFLRSRSWQCGTGCEIRASIPPMLDARPWARAVALLAAAAIGCGPATHGSGATRSTRAGVVRAVTPLQFGAEARDPTQALILGTDPRGGGTTVRLAGRRNAVTVDGEGPIELTTAPATDGRVAVGLFAASAGGLGPSWRAGVWMAAQVASRMLDKDVTDLDFTAHARGHVDGVASSALMTAGFLAATLGVAIDPGATVIGSIAPDGTIGPVDELARQLDAALAAGKRRIGYPAGTGHATDPVTGQPIDVAARALAGGATAVEIADVGEALELLTGARLARPLPVDEVDLALEDAVVAELGARYDTWHQRLAAEWTRVLVLRASGRVPSPLADLAALAERELALAERLHQRGRAVAAYRVVVQAWIDAAAATAGSAVLDAVRSGDLVAARARLDQLAAMGAGPGASLRAIGAVVPASVGANLRMLAAFDEAIEGWSFGRLAEGQLAAARAMLELLAGTAPAHLATRAAADELATIVIPAARSVARAVAADTTAAEVLALDELAAAPTLAYQGSVPAVRRMTGSVAAAASARLAALDAGIVGAQARVLDLPLELARIRVAVGEPDYLIALLASNVDARPDLPADLDETWGEDSMTWALFRLAARDSSGFRTSLLLGRDAALAVEHDPATGEPTVIGQPAALAAMLTSAERRAREQAGAARIATGSIPLQVRLRYQLARSLADGDLAEQLAALASYWAASRYADIAVTLARNPR